MLKIDFIGSVKNNSILVDFISNYESLINFLKNEPCVPKEHKESVIIVLNGKVVSNSDVEFSQSDKIALFPLLLGG